MHVQVQHDIQKVPPEMYMSEQDRINKSGLSHMSSARENHEGKQGPHVASSITFIVDCEQNTTKGRRTMWIIGHMLTPSVLLNQE